MRSQRHFQYLQSEQNQFSLLFQLTTVKVTN